MDGVKQRTFFAFQYMYVASFLIVACILVTHDAWRSDIRICFERCRQQNYRLPSYSQRIYAVCNALVLDRIRWAGADASKGSSEMSMRRLAAICSSSRRMAATLEVSGRLSWMAALKRGSPDMGALSQEVVNSSTLAPARARAWEISRTMPGRSSPTRSRAAKRRAARGHRNDRRR